MPQKPKARGSTSENSKKKKEKTQSERFIKTARTLGLDESGKDFERALSKVIRPKRP